MIALNKTVTKKYAYVKNNVIFDIKSSDNGDSCVVPITEETVPYVIVDGTRQYFNGYIEDGDTHTDADGFKKTVHSADKTKEESLEYPVYYRNICEEEIANSIISKYTLTYEDFTKDLSKLGVPTWMLVQDPKQTVVEGIQKIDFTLEYYNESKEDSIKKLALQAASDTTNKYGYKLIEPAEAEELEIQKLVD